MTDVEAKSDGTVAARSTIGLSNLICNAAKYTPAHDLIEVTVTLVDAATIEIAVNDTGIGLTVVRRLVDLHGGTVEARSAGLGRGSEFIVRMPMTEGAAPVVMLRSEGQVSRALRILVAGENRDAVERLVLLLQLTGHEVYTSFDGNAAFEAIKELSPDVGLLDIGMPGSNGYDVAKRARSLVRGERIYLVALTGWGQEADKERARQAGFDAHLIKPMALETLDRLLASVAATRGEPSVPSPGDGGIRS